MVTGPIILFDDLCNLCSGFVQFVIKRDKDGVFKFASLQSAIGQELQRHYGMDSKHIATMVLIDASKPFTRSDAAIRIAWRLGWQWKAFVILRLFPRVIRDLGYRVVSYNRYRWFGKRESCWLPTPELESRFLTDASDMPRTPAV